MVSRSRPSVVHRRAFRYWGGDDGVAALHLGNLGGYTHCYGAIALAAKKTTMLKTALDMLKQLKSSEQIFNTQRLELLVSVTDMLAGKQVKSATAANGAGTYSNFLILQPSIMGFGINFNAIIDYLARRKLEADEEDDT